MSENKVVLMLIEPHAPLSEKLKAELAALAEMPDEAIDTSDIPPLEEDFWKKAVRNPFYRPPAGALSVELDADVVDWLRSSGDGSLKRLNAILRREMTRELGGDKPTKKAG